MQLNLLDTVDHRIEHNLASLFDCYSDSVGEVLGHESEKDDDAESGVSI